MSGTRKKTVVVAISGASGAILGIRALDVLQNKPGVETHLIVTEAARITIDQETDWSLSAVESLANFNYSPNDIGAKIASGSFTVSGMLVIPCSIKTLSAVANSYASDLVSRSADVQLKEGRPVVLVVRETPLHSGHLRIMQNAALNGAVIMPPLPVFYGKPQTVDDIVDGIVGRALLRIGIENELYYRWKSF